MIPFWLDQSHFLHKHSSSKAIQSASLLGLEDRGSNNVLCLIQQRFMSSPSIQFAPFTIQEVSRMTPSHQTSPRQSHHTHCVSRQLSFQVFNTSTGGVLLALEHMSFLQQSWM